MLTNTVETVLQSELLPGERLLWSGQPRQGIAPRLRNLTTIPVGLVWGLIASTLLVGGLTGRDAWPMALCGLPLGVGALFLVGWPFVGDALQRRHTYYGLTNQRLLIVAKLWQGHVRALNLRTLNEVQLSLGRGGRGTLAFGAAGSMLGMVPTAWLMGGRFGPAAFEDIEQPRAVYEQIHATQARLLEGG